MGGVNGRAEVERERSRGVERCGERGMQRSERKRRQWARVSKRRGGYTEGGRKKDSEIRGKREKALPLFSETYLDTFQ